MRIARFSINDSIYFGIVHEDDTHIMALKGDPMFTVPEASGEIFSLEEVRLLSPVIPRSKVLCVGRNYAEHAREMGNDVPDEPLLFMKPNTAVIGPEDAVVRPAWSTQLDHEVELAVVIKTMAKDVEPQQVKNVIFGYTVANDFTARDKQREDKQWTRAKGFDSSCPLGPWIVVDPDLDVTNLSLECEVNGQIKQQGNTGQMVFPIPELISYMSKAMTLLPGDVILTGTPSGISTVEEGDLVTSRISGIGQMTNRIMYA